ncbi:MAG: Mu-like prophage major head subunit gpT family protein [Phycisphaerales bacterium]|nr:MAG: Mu-like prophage major head subunit gpT family protein [Phycisphaerales bacterium]
MIWRPDDLRVKGALAAFQEPIDAAPNVWQNHVMTTESTGEKETYTFAGAVPVPREMVDGRTVQGLIDHKFDVKNKTYEATWGINREYFEDDQTGQITRMFGEMGEAFANWKDYYFATSILEGSSVPPIAGADGWSALTTFFDTAFTVGESGTMDNLRTSTDDPQLAVTDSTMATASEFIGLAMAARKAFLGYKDDKARLFNTTASQRIRAVIPPGHERGAAEALQATFIAQSSGSQANVWKGMFEYDVLPYLTGTKVVYWSALGGIRKPYIHQGRDNLEVIVDLDPVHVAERNSVLVLCRERFRIEYGDPRRGLKQTLD